MTVDCNVGGPSPAWRVVVRNPQPPFVPFVLQVWVGAMLDLPAIAIQVALRKRSGTNEIVAENGKNSKDLHGNCSKISFSFHLNRLYCIWN